MPPTVDPPLDPELRALEDVCRGRFAIEHELGRGGMGIVVLARDLSLDRPVAIKLLPAMLARQPHLRERFLREARTAAGLAHPNIVPIHAVEAHGDVVFFVMGYVEGETLARRVARAGPMPASEAARMLRDVAWALAYAHGRGIVHRDIKPDNILLDRASGRAVVTDFGIARVVDEPSSLTLDGHVMGTAQYMSPEQAAGEPVDGRSDLYSLGAVGFVALAGRPPFQAPTVPALLAMQLMQEPPPVASLRAGLPARLADVVDHCLAKRVEDRFPSAEALASALDESGSTPPAVAPQVRNFVRMAEQSTMVLTTMMPLMLAAPQVRGRVATGVVALLAALIAVGADMLRRARHLLMEGFSAADVVRAFLLERDARADEVAALYRRDNDHRLRRSRRTAGVIAGVAVALLLAGLAYAHGLPVGLERTAVRSAAYVALLVALVAIIVAINSSAQAERRSGALAGRIWRGRFTLYFFRLAGIGLGAPSPARSAPATNAEPTLPDEVLARHPALPRLLHDASELARALADRAAEIERVLVESGAGRAEPPAGGTTTRAELVSRRLALVSDLRTSLEDVRSRRVDVVAASENVRIQLARIRAGLAASADLDEDVTELQALADHATARGPSTVTESRLAASTPA